MVLELSTSQLSARHGLISNVRGSNFTNPSYTCVAMWADAASIMAKGSSGGHKGLASIVENVGSSEFARIRIGIGRSGNGKGLVEHVLTPFSGAERKEMERTVDRAAETILCIMESGIDAAMNKFNVKGTEQN